MGNVSYDLWSLIVWNKLKETVFKKWTYGMKVEQLVLCVSERKNFNLPGHSARTTRDNRVYT